MTSCRLVQNLKKICAGTRAWDGNPVLCDMMWRVLSDINKLKKGKKEIEIKNCSKTSVGIDGARLLKDTSRFIRI